MEAIYFFIEAKPNECVLLNDFAVIILLLRCNSFILVGPPKTSYGTDDTCSNHVVKFAK